jgi:Undecaprenyl-phosphate glucose phosphotransferase
MFHAFGAYTEERLYSKRHAVQRILAAWAITFAILLFIAFALKISDFFSRVWAVTWFGSVGCLLLVARISLSEWMQRRAKEGALAERTIIFGAGEFGQRFAAQIQEIKDPFVEVLGFIDDRATRVPRSSVGLELLGNSETLLHLIRANMVDHIFVALPWSARQRLSEVIEQLALTPVRISLVSDPLGFNFPVRSIKYINKAPTLMVLDRPLTGWSHLMKWIEDRFLSAAILVFIGPLMALIAIAIKFDSPGPVFFKQKRFGFNNHEIDVWKFRTMYMDDFGPNAPFRQAIKNDPRITPLGRFLRKSSLDELPQFINVLLGDMSIVGPRPHAIAHTYHGQQFEDVIDRYAARHRVKPGITGWAQINGWRGETDTVEKLNKRVEFDLYYIENWTLWLDIYIIMRTLFLIFRDDYAH